MPPGRCNVDRQVALNGGRQRDRIVGVMPEYPDIVVYVEALQRRIGGLPLEKVRIGHPFLLRTVSPTLDEVRGKTVRGVERIGKRIVIALETELFVVIHLMIAGRLTWNERDTRIPRKLGLAAFDFGEPSPGTLVFTEAGTKKRASLHLIRGRDSLRQFHRGGLDPIGSTVVDFAKALRRENHTVKRTLTDPRLIAGIGNAYSDEILHRAGMSPFKQTHSLSPEETDRLFRACTDVLSEWATRLRTEAGSEFPRKVTAFRKEMAVHGKYGEPCPICGTVVQRISYAESECNYCPTCQTGGKLLADRALSRLLKGDWPATLSELEELRQATRGARGQGAPPSS